MTDLSFSTRELVVSAIQGFLSAAALNLGEPAADGGTMAEPDAGEAWLALLCAGALIDTLSPYLAADFVAPVAAQVGYLAERLEARHGLSLAPSETSAPAAQDDAPLERLADVVAGVRAAGTAPLPGKGLPSRGSSPLYPD